MERISEEGLDALDITTLVQRMDDVLASPSWQKRGNDIMKLSVSRIFDSSVVQRFDSTFQRKVIYKVFGFLLQLMYTDFAASARFFHLPGDPELAKEIDWAAREQWVVVSSRMAFEYFMHLTYMLGTGEDFQASDSAIKKYRKWLKRPDNPYTYFAISAAKAKEYDRTKRTPEVHGTTKLARQVLLMSASDIDNKMFDLPNILRNQWQFVLDIANEREPNGWAANGDVSGDREWYALWESGNHDAITAEIDRMFSSGGF